MSRKDTILIAVIINAGLLAILFATAIIYDTDKLIDQMEFDTSLAEAPPIRADLNTNYALSERADVDEMDQEIQNYVEPVTLAALKEEELHFPEAPPSPPPQETQVNVKNEQKAEPAGSREVIVKKGDSLDKIARANRTTISAIKSCNRLNSERLSIGQVLKMPKNSEAVAPVSVVVKPVQATKKVTNSNAVYHIVKSGESPWKIAKLYGVNYEQILKLNNLNEEKARNLKIGDRIRVK